MCATMLDGVVPPLIVAAVFLLLMLARRLVLARCGWRPQRADAAVIVGIVGVTCLLEIGMGRAPTYRNGPVRLWVSDINSDQNSQQVTDPYTFSHVIHGALFYGATHLALGPASSGLGLLTSIALESMWETYENTDTVINRYRAATIARGYYGDSVLNSMADIVACLAGFVLARRFRWWWTASWILATELLLAVTIRDNLTLNIIMLIRPIEAIRRWQMGA
jgi:hypothetical protein